jgi:hypothetical protein
LATPSVASVGDPIMTQFLGLGRPDTKADLGVCDERRGYPRPWAECNTLRSAAFSSERPINRDDGASSADGIRSSHWWISRQTDAVLNLIKGEFRGNVEPAH